MYTMDEKDSFVATLADIEHVRLALVRSGGLVDLLIFDMPAQTVWYGCERQTVIGVELIKLGAGAGWTVGYTHVAHAHSCDNAVAALAARWRLLCTVSRCTVFYPLDLGEGWLPGADSEGARDGAVA